MRAFARLVMCAAVAALCAFAASCGDTTQTNHARSDKETAALAAADDSMAVNSPQSLNIIKNGMANAEDSLAYYDWYLRLLRYSVQHDVPDTAKLHWGQAFNFLSRQKRTPRVDGMMAYLLNAKGSYYIKLHYDPAMATRAYEDAYRLMSGSDDKQRVPDVCANLGDAYVAANDMPRAALWYRRALFLADSLQVPDKDNVSLYMGLGRIYLKLGDFGSALECYKTADSKFHLMPLNMKLYFLCNYGNYFYYANDYKSAEAVFTRMKKLLETERMDDCYEMYLCKINMADIQLNLGNIGEAQRLLDESYPYFAKLGDDTGVYYGNTIQIGIALKADDMATVRRILDSEEIDTTIDFNLANIRQRYLREYYVKQGDYEKAYYNLRENISRNDSLKHNIENMRTSEIMMRYSQDTLQLHHQIEMQEKDNAIRTTRAYLYVGLLLLAALVLLLLYLFTYTRKRRLQMHMQLMQTRLANVRSRISPHFIFNVLNNRIAKTDKADAEELMSLAKLIRANLNMSGKYYVTLAEELDFVRYYISVVRNSIDGELDFKTDVPEDGKMADVMVPSMFIQILVENSIKHGLKKREGTKRLRISVTKDDDECRITVTDNGTGFDIRHSDPASTKTGLKVIRKTISIINHENKRKIRLGIRNIEAADGSVMGCEVTLVLPLGLKFSLQV